MSVLIHNTTILTQDGNRRQIRGDIFIDDGIIAEISEKNINTEAEFNIDGSDKLTIPGLMNTHTHIPLTLLRGYGDDMMVHGHDLEPERLAELLFQFHCVVASDLAVVQVRLR